MQSKTLLEVNRTECARLHVVGGLEAAVREPRQFATDCVVARPPVGCRQINAGSLCRPQQERQILARLPVLFACRPGCQGRQIPVGGFHVVPCCKNEVKSFSGDREPLLGTAQQRGVIEGLEGSLKESPCFG